MKRRVAICHPRLGRGGSEARALWLLQSLREHYSLTLLTLGPVRLQDLNRYYGTELHEADFAVSRPVGGPGLSRMTAGAALRGALMQRHARARAEDFDLVISAYNPVDFGRPGIQFLADFSFIPRIRQRLHGQTSALDRVGVGRVVARRVYKRVVGIVSGRDAAGDAPRSDDMLIANSRFAAEVLKQQLSRACQAVIYPPVQAPRGDSEVTERTKTFVSVGRISPEKRIHDQIDILQQVRARGHDISLRIFGGPVRGSYPRRIRSLVDTHARWVTWEGWIQGRDKWEMLQACRFGIQSCRGEAFGISAAEMARSGCIVFAPALGGPAEIVADSRLTYSSGEEAVDRICAVLEDEALQQRLSTHLRQRGDLFSVKRFCDQSLELVEDAITSGM